MHSHVCILEKILKYCKVLKLKMRRIKGLHKNKVRHFGKKWKKLRKVSVCDMDSLEGATVSNQMFDTVTWSHRQAAAWTDSQTDQKQKSELEKWAFI